MKSKITLVLAIAVFAGSVQAQIRGTGDIGSVSNLVPSTTSLLGKSADPVTCSIAKVIYPRDSRPQPPIRRAKTSVALGYGQSQLPKEAVVYQDEQNTVVVSRAFAADQSRLRSLQVTVYDTSSEQPVVLLNSVKEEKDVSTYQDARYTLNDSVFVQDNSSQRETLDVYCTRPLTAPEQAVEAAKFAVIAVPAVILLGILKTVCNDYTRIGCPGPIMP